MARAADWVMSHPASQVDECLAIPYEIERSTEQD